MTCYMRHMHWLFEALDQPFDAEHKKLMDRQIRESLKTPDDAHCPQVWAAVKALSPDERLDLVADIRARTTA